MLSVSLLNAVFAAIVLATAELVAAQAVVTTPATLTQCQPAAVSWTGATGTVYISVHEGVGVAANKLEAFPDQSGATGTYTWTVDVPAGTTVSFHINDGSGLPNYSAGVTVGAGSDDCKLVSTSGGSSGGSSSTGATPVTTSPTSSSGPSSNSNGASGGSAGTSGTKGPSKPSGSSAGAGTANGISSPSSTGNTTTTSNTTTTTTSPSASSAPSNSSGSSTAPSAGTGATTTQPTSSSSSTNGSSSGTAHSDKKDGAGTAFHVGTSQVLTAASAAVIGAMFALI